MTPRDLLTLAVMPALALLPEHMDTQPARALLLAIALQESGLRNRFQQDGDDDPYDHAVGLWQFERIGITGVQGHHATDDLAAGVNRVLLYQPDEVFAACAHNDVLQAAYARLNLWTLPGAIPGPNEPERAGQQYLAAWRPGKPHMDDWAANYRAAWEAVA